MRKEIFACILLALVLCMLVGCAGRKGAEGGYRDDSIGDAGLDGITNGKKKGADIDPKMEEAAGAWYEQSARRAIMYLAGNQLTYNVDGKWKLNTGHSGSVTGQQEADGTYRIRFEAEGHFFTDIRYKPDEDILLATDKEGTESIFKRTKYVPNEEELKADALAYPAPDESACGYWIGRAEEENGECDLTLLAPDEAGRYEVEVSLVWRYSDSGNGMFMDTLELNAEAVVKDGVMTVRGTYNDYSGTPESERTFRGVLEQHEDGLRFLVLECGSYLVHPGDWFDVHRL